MVACQGTEGAYSALAAEKLFRYPQLCYYDTWEEVFQAIDRGDCAYGVLPLENSNAGSVTRVYDLMVRYHVRIVRSTRLHVDPHQLLAEARGQRYHKFGRYSPIPKPLLSPRNISPPWG